MKLRYLSNFSFLILKKRYKNKFSLNKIYIKNKINYFLLNSNNKFNKKKYLYLKKEIIYFYFSSYIFNFLLLNIKINLSNVKTIYFFDFVQILKKFFKLKKIKLKKLNRINILSKNLKILYIFKHNKNINNNLKCNLLFSTISFYKFIKNINFILIIFYKFIKKFNNKKFYFIKNKLIKNFFSYFEINNLISYNNLLVLLFYFKNSIFDLFLFNNNNNNNIIKILNIKDFDHLNEFLIFNKNKNLDKMLLTNIKIKDLYFFLNKKKNFNISIFWFSKITKLKNIFKVNFEINLKYYNLNCFQIKTDNKNFKIITFLNNSNYYFLLPFKINYLNIKIYKKKFYFKTLNYLIKKNQKLKNIKLKGNYNINSKFYYYCYLINNKILKKLNNLFFKNHAYRDINLLNKFLNLFNKYENLLNFINLNNIFQNKWLFYFKILNINAINIKIQFSFLNKIFFINNNNKQNKLILKKDYDYYYYYYNFYFFNINNLINNKNNCILKKYYIRAYFKKNILLFTKSNYSYNYLIFYKYNFNFIFLSNYFFKNINENITFVFNNFYINKNKIFNLKIKLLFPIQTLYLFKIQSKLNIKKNKLSIFLFYFLFNINKNKIKKNNLFNFLKLKSFNFKLKYFFTQYNNLNIKNIFFNNLNYILIGNFYNLNKSNFIFLKNKKLQKKFKIIFNTDYNKYYINKKNNTLIKYNNNWFYITNKFDFLFVNYKKIIFKGNLLNKNILFDNKITLNKLFPFRFKNTILKNIFNIRIYLLKSFINFKIKKNFVNSIFIFYGSKFFNFYLQKSIFNFNNFIFNSYKIIKNKNSNFYFFIQKPYFKKWFNFTKFYFYKIKIKSFIYNNKINNKKLNINLLNNYYRIIFLQTTILKKINNFLYSFPISLKLIKYNILNKKKFIKNTLINSNILINNFLNYKNSINNFKRIFLIYNSKIIFNNYNRYKPKLLIYKIIFKCYNLIIKFNKLKNICIIEKSIDLNNLNIISKSLFLIENKTLLSQNNLRYYILKFPFKSLVKIKKYNKYFISNTNKMKKNNNLLKLTYSNFLFLNKNTINLSNSILIKNNYIKRYFYNYLLFLNQKIYKMFYNLFYLKGFKYLKNYFSNMKIIINKNFIALNKRQYNTSFINFIINKKNFILFFIYNKINYKILKLYLIKNKENYFFNFNISICPFIYFYKYNILNNNNLKKNSNLTIKIISKNINTSLLNFTKKFNINFYQFKNINKIEHKNYISNIYIYFRPFIIEKNNFLIQLNLILNSNFNFNNMLLLTSLNNISNNIVNKLKLIKINKISINFNNYKNLINKKKINLKLNTKLSIFKGEVLNTYNLAFFYYYNYLKKNKNIKNINHIFNLKYYLKEKISLFPEIIYLTNDDFITYKLINNNKFKRTLGEFVSCSTEIILNSSINESGQIIFVNKNKIILRRAKELLLSAGCIFNLKQGDFINNNSPLLTLIYKNLKTEDIVQGIPKIEQIFEARENLKDTFSLNSLIKFKFKNYKKIYSKKEAVHRSIIFIQQYIVDSVQKVYQSQGVNISDKHIEIIVKQMTSKVKITDPGNTGLLRGDIVYLDWIELINNGLKGKKSQYEPIILGISKACLEMDGFISSASFQETIKILSKAAILQKRDFLRGLKENLILGHLVPVGTGFEFIN